MQASDGYDADPAGRAAYIDVVPIGQWDANANGRRRECPAPPDYSN